MKIRRKITKNNSHTQINSRFMARYKLSDCTLLIVCAIGRNYVRLYFHPIYRYILRFRLRNDKPNTIIFNYIGSAQSMFNDVIKDLVRFNPIYPIDE